MNIENINLIGMKHKFGEQVILNQDIEKEYNLPSGWVFEKTGKKQGHSWENKENAPVIASLECFDKLLVETGIDKNKIKVIFGTTNPITVDGVTDEVSLTHKFASASGLDNIEIRDCSYGCGGVAIGIKEMKEWFKDKPKSTYAVYVTQDWSTKMVEDRNVKALFSDAVSVSLWSNDDNGGLYELADVFATDSTIPEESLGMIGGVWKMNGRDVVEQASQVPSLVAESLGIQLSDYDIVPHQPNPKLLETIEKMHNIELFKEVSIEHGNPTCSGSFIALEKRMEGREGDKRDILVMPFGAGGIGGFILRKKR